MEVEFVTRKQPVGKVTDATESITGWMAQFEIRVGRTVFFTPWFGFKNEDEVGKRERDLKQAIVEFTGNPEKIPAGAKKKAPAKKSTVKKPATKRGK